MHGFITLAFVAGASTLHVPRSSCSFELTASGGESGTIGQLSDGQNRIGGGLAATTFTIENGGIMDAAGRGCILTPSVEQFQCDQGVGPTYGFAIQSNGTLTSSDSSTFYACPASDTEWNIYTTPVVGQEKCVEISLSASDCGSSFVGSATLSDSAFSEAPVTVTTTVYGCASSSSISGEGFATAAEIPQPETVVPVAVTSVAETPATPAQSESVTPTAGTAVAETSASISYSEETTPAVVSSIAVAASSVPGVINSAFPSSSGSPDSQSLIASVLSPVDTFTSVVVSTAPTSTYSIQPSGGTDSKETTTSTATGTSSASSCVATTLTGSDTSGNYQYPHLIIPISSQTPTTTAGTQYFGTISSNVSTIFNFDIPTSYARSTCSLIFLLPLQSELETSSYTFSGAGSVDFKQLSSAASEDTTWDDAPSVEKDLGTYTLTEGSTTLVESFGCPAGATITYEMSAVGDTDLYYFQDWNPSPLGLFLTYC